MPQQQFTVTNFHCAACAKVVSLLVKKIPGVTDVTADEKSGRVTVTADQDIPFETFREKLQPEYDIIAN